VLCVLWFHLAKDDHLGSITNCSGNVMYKAAGRSFLTNGKNLHLLRCHLTVKMAIVLPRQARDKHRESTQKHDAFLQEVLATTSPTTSSSTEGSVRRETQTHTSKTRWKLRVSSHFSFSLYVS